MMMNFIHFTTCKYCGLNNPRQICDCDKSKIARLETAVENLSDALTDAVKRAEEAERELERHREMIRGMRELREMEHKFGDGDA